MSANEIDNYTEVQTIFNNSNSVRNNSAPNANSNVLYQNMNILDSFSINKNDQSSGIFSCKTILSKLNKDTPTSLSSNFNLNLNEDNSEATFIPFKFTLGMIFVFYTISLKL